MELSVLDLFSGIGGFSVGLESTGKFKTVAFCEQDKFCQKVLHKHWPNIPIHEDIKKLDGTKIKADVLVGGFPCQSFSVAGKQKGKDDERYLWDEMFRVIKEVKPRWIIGENVQNLINIADGQILQGIHNDLESENFEVQTFNISASSQGAWHKRSRVWIVAANTKCLGFSKGSKESKKFKGKETSNKYFNCNQGSQFREACYQMELSNTKSIRSQGHELQHNLENGQKLTKQLCQTDIKKQQTWWETESKLFGIPYGISTELDTDRANRIKALGNSIVPHIITEIGKAIIEAEKEMNEWN
jgi:DNA (cytosine-5)-methyltransferase 1